MGRGHRRTTREDDVTEPGYARDVSDADRAEQEALLEPPSVLTAADASPPPEDVPEADALEQQIVARPAEAGAAPPHPLGLREADEADVLEQETEVPAGDGDDDLG
jgi:hypothetical protein